MNPLSDLKKRLERMELHRADGDDYFKIAEDAIRLCANLEAEVKKLLGAMAYFVERVDRGEVRSRRTYAQFKGFLAASRLFKGEK